MALISKHDVAGLSRIHEAFCVSIFIPTHRAGQPVLNREDAVLLKNQVAEVRDKLEGQGLHPREIERLLEPVYHLLEDGEFWRHQSDGLAVFLTDGFFSTYTLPVRFSAFNHVSNAFYLKPLMPMFTGDGRFFLLTLDLEDPRFYEGTRYSITEVQVEDLIPSRMEEVVGYDYEEKSLQFRNQRGGQPSVMFHGRGEGKDDRKDELLQYFRAIDKGLMAMLHDEDPPMVFAGQDYLFPIYKTANTYQHLYPKHLSGNPAHKDVLQLHEEAWELLQEHFDRKRREKQDAFRQHQGTGRTESDIRNIIPAALEGKIDTLFLQNHSDIWGIYNPSNGKVDVQEVYHAPNVSLLNLAAIQVFLQGGSVYLLESEDMPDNTSKVNALFRY